jgi:hypothetical protein
MFSPYVESRVKYGMEVKEELLRKRKRVGEEEGREFP